LAGKNEPCEKLYLGANNGSTRSGRLNLSHIANSVTVTGGSFSGATHGSGIYLNAPLALITISDKSFAGNRVNIRNAGGNLVNASGNCWGASTETAVAGKIVSNVDYSP
jgi:hypothetical protein